MSTEAVCRVMQSNDTEAVKHLWKICFEDTEQFVDWYFQEYYHPENTLGIFSEGSLQASAQMIPYTIQLRQAPCSVSYIVGVDTAPDARNRGYAKRLLYQCLEKMRQRRLPLALLMPFAGHFYYRYGFTFCYVQKQYQVAPKELRCAAEEYGQVQMADGADWVSALNHVYESFVQFFHGWAYRDAGHWKNLIADGKMEGIHCYLLQHNGQVEGYCFAGWREDTFFVREIAYLHEEARKGLLYFLQMQPAQTLLLYMDDEDPLLLQLANAKTVVQAPFLMTRIVDVPLCLKMLAVQEGMPAWTLSIIDDFLPWNNGSFLIAQTNEKLIVTPVIKAESDVIMSIEALAQLMMGAQTTAQLERMGLLKIHKDSLRIFLQQLWPKMSNYINEYY